MSTLKCPKCFIEVYGLEGEKCERCGELMYIFKENTTLDEIRRGALTIPINTNPSVVNSLLDIFEENN